MPKRKDLNKIMIIGSGPIVIGQACEFDYSGSQACRILKEEGYSVILVNSNPASIMTDFETADRTYIEPITQEVLTRIIEQESPDAILPTLGGQIALNTIIPLYKEGVLNKFGVEIIGASIASIEKAEFRDKFKKSMHNIGLRVTKSDIATNVNEAITIAKKISFPMILRSSFTMGGSGSRIVNNIYDLEKFVSSALHISPVSQIILEESITGWKEYELELMRDCKDNVVVVCSIENIDPVGVHTGDSITVAPVQTLTDKEYQNMRDAAIKVIREIGVNTGGANVQFAINPQTGEMIVIEMNPRVSRSSALASKATGFPIAKIAAKLAIGYTLDEITNDITGKTLACFEPTMDYCVVKMPIWNFEKFNPSDCMLSTEMKSVGETMAIGRTFKEALQKAMRSSGTNIYGFGANLKKSHPKPITVKELIKKLNFANYNKLIDIYHAFDFGMTVLEISKLTKIDPWFIFQFYQLFEAEASFKSKFTYKKSLGQEDRDYLRIIKMMGFSDKQITELLDIDDEDYISNSRKIMKLLPVYKSVDTCAAEFSASSPYYYSSYETESDLTALDSKKKVIILGSGPNRIGQGIEFDYCCVHASIALNEEGFSSIMLNSNPETVSTDYDISDRLYFEPLTYEDVMNIVLVEKPHGVIVQFGGQISLKLSKLISKAGAPILGTQPEDIYRAENRNLFKMMLNKLGLNSPNSFAINSVKEAINAVAIIGYPVIIRPSFIIGGEAIKIAYNYISLLNYTREALNVSSCSPVLIDEFLNNALELDVDIISDGCTSTICGIMEHVEEAGIHSGDSACILPSINVDSSMLNQIKDTSKLIASELNIIGLMNIQYAIKDRKLYVIEVNPRASRSIPFVSKAIGKPIAKLATKVILGKKLFHLGLLDEIIPDHISVKESVFPFERFPNSNIMLSPEMKSTGEVMGIGASFASAYAKAQIAAGQHLPTSGSILINFCHENKQELISISQKFKKLGFDIINIYDLYTSPINDIKNGKISLVISIHNFRNLNEINCEFCRTAIKFKVPYVTTINGALATYCAIEFLRNNKKVKVKALQDYHFKNSFTHKN